MDEHHVGVSSAQCLVQKILREHVEAAAAYDLRRRRVVQAERYPLALRHLDEAARLRRLIAEISVRHVDGADERAVISDVYEHGDDIYRLALVAHRPDVFEIVDALFQPPGREKRQKAVKIGLIIYYIIIYL